MHPMQRRHPRQPNFSRVNQPKDQKGQYEIDWFVYDASFGNIAAAASVPISVAVQADSDFELQKLAVFGFINGVTEPPPDNILLPMLLQITDSGSGRQLFSAATPVNNVAGNGKLPFILPVPRIFLAKSSIQLTMTSIAPASTYNQIHVSLIGRKIFKFSPG